MLARACLLIAVLMVTIPVSSAFLTGSKILVSATITRNGLPPRSLRTKNHVLASASRPSDSVQWGRREALLRAIPLFVLGTSTRAEAVRLPQTQIESQGAGGAGLKTLSNTGIKYTGRLGGGKEVPGSVAYELEASDGRPVLISFEYPEDWSSSTRKVACSGLDQSTCSSGDISVRDLRAGLSAFVVVAPAPPSGTVDVAFLKQHVYGKDGKYGAYGAPDEVSIAKRKSLQEGMAGSLLDVKFTAFTPNMRTLAKRSVISAISVGPDVFMLVATTTDNRFKNDEGTLRKIVDSFVAAAAPSRR